MRSPCTARRDIYEPKVHSPAPDCQVQSSRRRSREGRAGERLLLIGQKKCRSGPRGWASRGAWGWLVASLVGGGAREEGAVLSGGRGGSPRPCGRQAGRGARGRSGRGSTRRDDARTPGPCSPPLCFLYPARICIPETGDQCPLHGEKPPATESRPRETVDSAGRPSAARGRTSPTVLTVSGPTGPGTVHWGPRTR